MLKRRKAEKWRDSVYLCTVYDSFQADIFESKLRSEGIPCQRNYQGAGNYLEICFGTNTTQGIDLYVPEECLEAAKNIIVPVDLDQCEIEEE